MAASEPCLPVRLGLSVLGTGYVRGGGSVASFLALIPAWFLAPYPLALVGIALVLASFGVWGSFYAERRGWAHDDRRITLDEFCGMLAAMILVPCPSTFWGKLLILGLAFLFFRLLDILKPPPVSLMERLPRGWGVVGDDVVAGLIANGLVQLTRLLPHGILNV